MTEIIENPYDIEKKHFDYLHDNYRDSLIRSSKLIIYLCTGSMAISITFLNLDKSPSCIGKYLLFFSWIYLLLTLFFSLYCQYLSHNSQSNACEYSEKILNAINDKNEKEKENLEKEDDKNTKNNNIHLKFYLNSSFLTLSLGVSHLAGFCMCEIIFKNYLS